MHARITQIIENIHELLKHKGYTLSVAESCTGGLISHCITSRPGASIFFSGGIVSYSEDMKKRVLGISHETIEKCGLISDRTAREMAEQVRVLAKSDYAISATGNLGPDVLEGKERGLVYIAASGHDNTISQQLKLKGSREENKEEAALAALTLLIRLLEGRDNVNDL